MEGTMLQRQPPPSDPRMQDQAAIHPITEESSSNDPTSSAKSDKSQTSTSNGLVSTGDTNAVNRSKLLVYLALSVAAGVVGAMTYVLTSNEETAKFEREFFSYSGDVATNADTNAAHIFSQIHTFATSITSTAISEDMVWPNVTMRHFDLRAREAEELAGMELVVFSPIVTDVNRAGWEEYAWEHQRWIDEDLKYRTDEEIHPGHISRRIYRYEEETGHTAENDKARDLTEYKEEFYVPVWQLGPVPRNASVINLDLFTHPSFKHMITDDLEEDHAALSDVVDLHFLVDQYGIKLDGFPRSYALVPVKEDFYKSSKTVGFVVGELNWTTFFHNVLPKEVQGIVVEVKGTCGAYFSFEIMGTDSKFLGHGEHHRAQYDSLKHAVEFAKDEVPVNDTDACRYTLTLLPTEEFEATYHTNKPAVYTTVVVMTFFFTAMTFALYDYAIVRRQRRLLAKAKRTTAIVSSMFPKEVQKRILEEAEAMEEEERKRPWKGRNAAKQQLKSFLNDDVVEGAPQGIPQTKPIADLFTDTTIAFMDIVGFTAYSSTRDPSQVFTLLETVFHSFDSVAKQRRVFKVETVGDCYVAVSGLPEPRKDHALVMARFARDCLYCFNTVVKQLETTLGPDTGELGIRIGLHSGPVTAGVLRGERARFQLFGDTINTCSRIETTGEKNKIHVSQETADRLATVHGKGHWCRLRDDKVVAKGKGELKTYWLELKGDSALSSRSGNSVSVSSDSSDLKGPPGALQQGSVPILLGTGSTARASRIAPPIQDKNARLVCWNAEVLAKTLREVVARREALGVAPVSSAVMRKLEQDQLAKKETVLEEFKEVVTLPKFDADAAKRQRDASTVDLGATVMEQLQNYLRVIVSLYRDNAFHNCEHATHVTMSVVKLLSRIVAPDNLETTNSENDAAKDLHDHTYGITSDPLTQFAVILSALIHDVDHTGVPNSQLVKEQAVIASVYKNKSVAEQNSVDIAWELLMDEEYEDLRRVIYTTPEEFEHFRHLIVNTVMATDIMDKELGALRKNRWSKAFSDDALKDNETEELRVNRKATIVIEHLIQASDVAHTMQHWQIYRKWNARFFEESYKAYLDGRAEKDPAESWYEGEIGFFDFYVIPLAMKLKNCGVFGVSSDEYLTYAQQNRREWESKGRQLVEEMIEAAKAKIESNGDK